MNLRMRLSVVSVLMLALVFVGDVAAQTSKTGAVVSGLQPDRRPVNAPVIAQMKKDGDWYARSLRGVTQPYPASLRFLEDQGAWYTPFNRPNQTGVYDIRGLYPTGDVRRTAR